MFHFNIYSYHFAPVGGQPSSSPQLIPYQVSLRRDINAEDFCGGVLIAPRHVITAAGCVDGKTRNDVVVGAGSNTRSLEQFHSVSGIKLHPGYNPATQQHDIAVIRTVSLFFYGDTVQPIPLSSTPIASGVFVTVSGWGQTSQSYVPYILQFFRTAAITNELCSTLSGGAIGPGQMCTRAEPNVVTCEVSCDHSIVDTVHSTHNKQTV